MTPEFTDTQRLDWLLETLYQHGWQGASKRLEWGYNEPTRRGIDAAIAKDLKATVRLWKCPKCMRMSVSLYTLAELDQFPSDEVSPVMCAICINSVRQEAGLSAFDTRAVTP